MTENTIGKITSKNLWARFSAITLLVCLTAFGSGCASTRTVSEPGAANADAFLDGFEFEGVAFKVKISEQNGLLPANKFWFDQSDDKTVTYGWNEIVYRDRQADVDSCNYAANQAGCLECRWCSTECSDGTDRVVTTLPVAVAVLKEISHSNNGSESILREFFSPLTGCLLHNFGSPKPTFSAKDNATYLITTQSPIGGNERQAARLRTFVLTGKRTVQRALEVYNDAADPATRFLFRARNTNGVIESNFSPNLKVTKVRVLLGVFDPVTTREMIMDDEASLRRVRPSRVMFLPDFIEGDVNDSTSEGTNRCYFDSTKDDGDFNLQTCRRNLVGPIQDIDVTPTYQHGRARDPLTWIVEYKTSDGLPQPLVLGANEFLKLELTIE